MALDRLSRDLASKRIPLCHTLKDGSWYISVWEAVILARLLHVEIPSFRQSLGNVSCQTAVTEAAT